MEYIDLSQGIIPTVIASGRENNECNIGWYHINQEKKFFVYSMDYDNDSVLGFDYVVDNENVVIKKTSGNLYGVEISVVNNSQSDFIIKYR